MGVISCVLWALCRQAYQVLGQHAGPWRQMAGRMKLQSGVKSRGLPKCAYALPRRPLEFAEVIQRGALWPGQALADGALTARREQVGVRVV